MCCVCIAMLVFSDACLRVSRHAFVYKGLNTYSGFMRAYTYSNKSAPAHREHKTMTFTHDIVYIYIYI